MLTNKQKMNIQQKASVYCVDNNLNFDDVMKALPIIVNATLGEFKKNDSETCVKRNNNGEVLSRTAGSALNKKQHGSIRKQVFKMVKHIKINETVIVSLDGNYTPRQFTKALSKLNETHGLTFYSKKTAFKDDFSITRVKKRLDLNAGKGE